MLYIDFQGESVEEATRIGLRELQLNEKDVKVEVLHEGKRGVFGLGKKTEAKVRIYYKEQSEIEDLLNSIKVMVGYMDREATVNVDLEETSRYRLTINSKNINHIIGKNGSHLQALQTLVNALLRKHNNRFKIVVSVDKYSQIKNNSLLKWIQSQVDIVLKNKRQIVLKSLNSYKRRIVHMEIQKYRNLISESKGEGKMKNIKISYVENKEMMNQDY